MKKILIATNNKGKLEELKNLLKEYEILSMKDVNCNIEVIEDGKTFEENAKKKAKEIYDITKIPCIADDSGLCIDYFDGWPGIYTARFLGPNSTKEEINNYILEKMKNLKDENRNAEVKCVVAYYNGSDFITGTGVIKGKIALSKRGDNGFGYDEIFELENGKTYAEISEEEKNKISHRRKAINELKIKLNKI